jgi:DNA-binding response OmpR family regulator
MSVAYAPHRCENCDYLEREIGLQILATEVDDVHRGMRVSIGQARLLIALFRAKRRVVSIFTLQEAMPPRNGNSEERHKIVQVQISFIRTKLGKDFILTSEGQGYRLSERGYEMMSLYLDPL